MGKSRKALKCAGIIILLLLLILGGYVIYVYTSYYRLPDKLVLEVNQSG